MKIGMFDSGIGGLSILNALKKVRNDVEIYYVADDAHAPYGNKSDDYVLQRCLTIVEIFQEKGIDFIVVACNTATAIAIDFLRKEYPHMQIVGIEPYINVINQIPSIKDEKSVVLTTPLMGESKRFSSLCLRLDPAGILDHYSCPYLAEIIEKHYYEKDQDIELHVRNELMPILGKGYKNYILGCTHYPLIADIIKRVTGASVLSPCRAVVKRVLSLLAEDLKKTDKKEKSYFLRTSIDESFKEGLP